MKKLQSNFTTPEQAYEIMRLGVNKSTADCWRQSPTSDIFVRCSEELRPDFFEGTTFIPCWSVGRLIEIMLLCHISISSGIMFDKSLYEVSNCANIEWCIRVLESGIQCGSIDFEKLKE